MPWTRPHFRMPRGFGSARGFARMVSGGWGRGGGRRSTDPDWGGLGRFVGPILAPPFLALLIMGLCHLWPPLLLIGLVALVGTAIAAFYGKAEPTSKLAGFGAAALGSWHGKTLWTIWAIGLSLGMCARQAENRHSAVRETEQSAQIPQEEKSQQDERSSRVWEEVADRAFRALPASFHLQEARNAMAKGYDANRKIGGDCATARRHLWVIPDTTPQQPVALSLLRECSWRIDRENLLRAWIAANKGEHYRATFYLGQVARDSPAATASGVARIRLRIEQAKRAEDRRQADAKRKEQREERKRQRQAEAALYTGDDLLCCDGSLSPTCSCSGSHRGCCSHHGGVCGCR